MRALIWSMSLIGSLSLYSATSGEASPFERLDALIGRIQGEHDPQARLKLSYELAGHANAVSKSGDRDQILVSVGELTALVDLGDPTLVPDYAVGALGSFGPQARLALPRLMLFLDKVSEEESKLLSRPSPIGRTEVVCESLVLILGRSEALAIPTCALWLEFP